MITTGSPSPDVIGYLDWVRSDAGQTVVEKIGYAPLPVAQRTPAK